MGVENSYPATSKPSALEPRTVPAQLAAPYRGPKEAKNFALLLLLNKFPFTNPTADMDTGYACKKKKKKSFMLLLNQHMYHAPVQNKDRQTSSEVSGQPQLDVRLLRDADRQGTIPKMINGGLPCSRLVAHILCSRRSPLFLPSFPVAIATSPKPPGAPALPSFQALGNNPLEQQTWAPHAYSHFNLWTSHSRLVSDVHQVPLAQRIPPLPSPACCQHWWLPVSFLGEPHWDPPASKLRWLCLLAAPCRHPLDSLVCHSSRWRPCPCCRAWPRLL